MTDVKTSVIIINVIRIRKEYSYSFKIGCTL
nr:MAG TPA: hypothetical protein [Caudoviricetes sp.]